MYKRIMVPLDGTALAENALGTAEEAARTSNGELLLVRTAYAGEIKSIDLSEAQSAAVAEARDYLNGVAARLQKQDLFVRTVVLYGEPIPTLPHFADGNGIDVIIMASHNRTGLTRLLLGSVSAGMIHYTSVPVIVVNRTEATSRVHAA